MEYNSWEDAQDAQDTQDEQLAQSAQRITVGSSTFQPKAPSFQPSPSFTFRPAANSFEPAAASFRRYEESQRQGEQQSQQSGHQHQQSSQASNVGSEPVNVASLGSTKVLSITSSTPTTSPSTSRPDKPTSESGAKVAASKALEKTAQSPRSTATVTSSRSSPTPSSGKSSPSRGGQRPAARDPDAVAKQQVEEVDAEILQEVFGKENVNVIFLGHVDAGKSTLGGAILLATGMLDERTMEKYRREAKEMGRESWWLSWTLDLTNEERAKGKTVEVGRGFFETEKRIYSLLDAPGHKTFVPNMISGAAQADIGVLVVSARKGEYETGFERGGQTREHTILAKTQGVNKLVVVVNKMDDPTVVWDKDRFNLIVSNISHFLKGLGYNRKTDLAFIPIAAQTLLNVRERVPKDICPFYDGPSLLEYLDSMESVVRAIKAPFMMPIAAKYRDMGTMVEGKIEAGVIKKDATYLMMPNREKVTIAALYGESDEDIDFAQAGKQVRIRIRGPEEEDILPGFVLCSPARPVHCVRAFEAQIVLLELRSILSAGFNCVMHVHSATAEVTFAALLHKLEKGTGRRSKKPPGFATKGMSILAQLEVIGSAPVCIERFEDVQQMGRFTLRDQGQTIAIGKITKLVTDESSTVLASTAA